MNAPIHPTSPGSASIRRRLQRGFTLIELLMVIGIIILMASLAMPALSGFKARGLVQGGNQITDMIQLARQNSMMHGALTALVMVQSGHASPQNWDYRAFILMQLLPGASGWTQASRWIQLPDGVTVDKTQLTPFSSSPALSMALTVPNRIGQVINTSDCCYQVFAPGGNLLTSGNASTTPPSLAVVEGAEGVANSASTENYYKIIINPYTGIAKVVRP